MAIGTVNIKVEVRPCYVDHRKGLFHGWFDYKEIVDSRALVGGPMGLVEFEDGKVEMVCPTSIRFADGGKFGELGFVPEEILDVVDDPDKRKEVTEKYYGNNR